MKLFHILAVAALSLGVVACDPATTPPPVSNGSAPAPGNGSGPPYTLPMPSDGSEAVPETVSGNSVANATIADEKAMYAAEALYNAPAYAYVAADTKGQLTADTKAKVKPLLVKSYAALKTARAAYAVGNSSDFFAAFENVKKLTGEAKALLPKAE
ncbi:hypothetical protein UFOVP131_30 [uncultured Caudovirales phage]|jgi:hypothetical protein|uniref:Lipoprotein n=1 Tax=uncultured Caudovirales phage TaxID=2100421 RepID=A0A6J5LJE9_9CAUD|nr:hypothetical protein UFOVP131_30 [uncultured Caudovirales phage]